MNHRVPRPRVTSVPAPDRRAHDDASSIRVDIVDPSSAAAQYCLREFFAELQQRFEAGFDPAHSTSATAAEMTLPDGLLLVATVDGAPAACGALKFHAATAIAEIKRMWVAPHLRGLGLGRRILDALVREATFRGVSTLRLETNRALTEAQHLYHAAGFVEVSAFSDEPYAHYWFERRLDPESTDET